MQSFYFGRYTLSSCVAVAMLAGCGGSQPPIGAPGAMPQSPAFGTVRAAHGLVAASSSFSVVQTFRYGHPEGALLDVGGTLYGTTVGAGRNDGSVYSINPKGVKKALHSFKGYPNDGAGPQGDLIDVNGILYGTTSAGGSCRFGTVYSISITGTEKVLKNFCGPESFPSGGLLNVNGTLYGVTKYTYITGKSGRFGDLFSITTSGKYKVLHVFDGKLDHLQGAEPNAGLVDVNGTIYGTTEYGGWGCTIQNHAGCGTVFSISADGKFKLLHRFVGGSDGAFPVAGLIDVNGTLYGTTFGGGTGTYAGCGELGCGTVYDVSASGDENVLYNFLDGSDGSHPNANLLESGGALYGVTEYGGGMNLGAIFTFSTSEKESVLHGFDGSQGEYPDGALIEMNDVLYGTTYRGGDTCLGGGSRQRAAGCGVVYAYPL